jgi:hypothetical protein
LKSTFAADEEAVDALVSLLKGVARAGVGGSDNGSSSTSGSSGSERRLLDKKCSSCEESGHNEESSLAACIDLLCVLVTHSEVKDALSEAGVISPLLRLLHREVSSSPLSSSSSSFCCSPPLATRQSPRQTAHHEGGQHVFRPFCTPPLPLLDRLVTLLRHLSWYHSDNMLVIVEEEGLELLTRGLRPGMLSFNTRADAVWILSGAVAYAAPALLAVGAVEATLRLIREEGAESGALEAALALLLEMLRFDNHKYLLRVLAVSGNLEADSSLPSPRSGSGTCGAGDALSGASNGIMMFAHCGTEGGEGEGGRWLTLRLREVTAGDNFSPACRDAASATLDILISKHVV